MRPLTPKERMFVREYLVDLDATNAAIRSGYSVKSAKRLGYRLVHTPHVQEAIQAGMNKRAQKIEVTADRVLTEIARMAFYDAGSLGALIMNPQTGEYRAVRAPADIALLPEDLRRVITGWSWDRNGNFTLKLADKLTALEKLGRHLKLFTDKVEVTGKDGAAIEVIDATAAAFDSRIASLIARASGAGDHAVTDRGGQGPA